MRSVDEIKSVICKLYSELGKDSNEPINFRVEDFTYYIIRSDGAVAKIRRKDIDDYFDSKDRTSESNIIAALNNFRISLSKIGGIGG